MNRQEATVSRGMARAWRVRTASCVAMALGALLAGVPLRAADDARSLVAEAQRRTETKSERYEGLLQVFDAKGKISDKRWTLERLGSHGDSKMVLRFTAPAEVKGVALLVVNHPDRASDQWMWTPAIERDRRIALQDRSTRFFGTDFSFEDLEERDVNQYDYTLDGDDTVDGAACWKISSAPRRAKSSQYTRAVVWIRKDSYALARIENYVRNEVVRRLNYSDIENVQGEGAIRARRACAMYAGTFLPGDCDAAWAVQRRERLRGRFVRLVEQVGAGAEADSAWDEAIAWYRQGLEADELAETFHQGLMRCFRALGRHAEGMSAYRRLRQTLSLTLGIAPSEQSQALARALQQDGAPA